MPLVRVSAGIAPRHVDGSGWRRHADLFRRRRGWSQTNLAPERLHRCAPLFGITLEQTPIRLTRWLTRRGRAWRKLSAEQEASGDGQALCGRPERRGGPTDR